MKTFQEYVQWREELWLSQGPQLGHGTKRWGKDAHPDDYNHKFGQPQGAGTPTAATPPPAQQQQRMKKMKRK